MPRATQNMPSLTLTSSAVDTSTQTLVAWIDFDDAESMSIWVNGNTTAPGLQFQVAMTSSSGSTFSPLLVMSSGASITYLSSGVTSIWPVTFKQARVGSSNVTSTSYTILANKQIEV